MNALKTKTYIHILIYQSLEQKIQIKCEKIRNQKQINFEFRLNSGKNILIFITEIQIQLFII